MMRKIALAICAAAIGVAFACNDEEHKRTSSEQVNATGGACEATPGNLPQANCDNSDKKCTATPGCSIDETKCGSSSTCLPTADNKGKDVLDFRLRRLAIAAPKTLAADFIQNTIVTLNIDLDAKECAENGKGLFTWLLRVDRKNNVMKTGGAPPSNDPFGVGFCFANFDLGANHVAPIESKIEFTGDTFESTELRDVNIPIFLSQDPASAIVLPISDVRISDVTISSDGNCIGSLNKNALDPSCSDDRSLCSKWNTSGALGGYITLEAAEGVKIRDLGGKSLCSFLFGESALSCPRGADGKIAEVGDYCSTTKSAGGCADSSWLAATFAGAAVKVDGSNTLAACAGTTSPDAGVDAGSDAGDGGSDAGSDAN